MADNINYYVSAIVLRVPDGAGYITSALCNHHTVLTYNGITFFPAAEIDYSKIAAVSISLTTKSFKISNIPAESGTIFGNVYDRIKYGHVEAFIYELEVGMSTDVVTSGRLVAKGLLYSASSWLNDRILDIEIKEDKYYYDKIGGVVCIEQCAVAYFGDKICKKTKTYITGVVQSIVRTALTFTGTPAGASFIYNNGYIELNGLRIKIAHWESGSVFSMSGIPPVDWVGETVRIYIGCDKTVLSCRDLHNNESNFFGLGFSMVDYNALYEET